MKIEMRNNKKERGEEEWVERKGEEDKTSRKERETNRREVSMFAQVCGCAHVWSGVGCWAPLLPVIPLSLSPTPSLSHGVHSRQTVYTASLAIYPPPPPELAINST